MYGLRKHGGLNFIRLLYIYFVYSNTRIIMQVTEPLRSTYASRFQQPFTVSQHPIFLSTNRPPQQSFQYSTFIPQQVAPMGSIVPRMIQPATSYQGVLPPILYPQYQQPLYPSGQPYLHPQFMTQPVSVVRRPQQAEQSQAYDYEQANRLCQAKIIENSIFCVVCGSEYKISEKDEHIKKHTRKGQERKVNQEVLHRLEDYHKKQTKQNYLVKPIVQPEELDLHFDPNVYEVIQEIIYQDESMMSKKEAAIGQDANNSFSYFDNNVSIAHNNALNLPAFDSEPNPFFSKTDKPHEYHVPEFEIPAPPQYESIQQDQPIIYQNVQVVPMATPINSHPPEIPRSIIEQLHNPPQNLANMSEPVAIHLPTEVYHSQRFSNPKTSLFSKQQVPEHRSQRYESNELKGFPQEELPKMDVEPIQRQESFSGPFEIRPPTEQSKKSTEVNVSQFIRDLNAQNQGLVVQSRKRIPNQSEW